MTCPICGKEIRDGSKFCTWCGKPIPCCPTCGKVIRKRTRFCTHDGTPLPEELLQHLPEKAPVPPVTPWGAQPPERPRPPKGEKPQPERSHPPKGEKPQPEHPRPVRREEPQPGQSGGKRTRESGQEGLAIKIVVILLAVLLVALTGVAVYLLLGGGAPAETGDAGGTPAQSGETGQEAEDSQSGGDGEASAQEGTSADAAQSGQSGEADAQSGQSAAEEAQAAADAAAEAAGDDAGDAAAAGDGQTQQEEPPAEPVVESVHRYEVIAADFTWQQARDACEARGGYLATITSEEEYQQIAALAEESGLRYLWLGGALQSVQDDWGDGSWITGEAWSYDNWYPGEPSKQDKDGTEELYLCLWNADYNEQPLGWTFNDQRADLVTAFPSISGDVGFVCEYEETR